MIDRIGNRRLFFGRTMMFFRLKKNKVKKCYKKYKKSKKTKKKTQEVRFQEQSHESFDL